MSLQIEYTDTFGGEANYCWVRRWHCLEERISDRQAVRLAKSLAGLTGARCRKEDMGDLIALYPAGSCTVLFLSYSESQYVQGPQVSLSGDILA